MLVVVLWWGRLDGEGFYPLHGDGMFPGPLAQDTYSRVSLHCAWVTEADLGSFRTISVSFETAAAGMDECAPSSDACMGENTTTTTHMREPNTAEHRAGEQVNRR